MKTIINWQIVNTRKKDKNYPDLRSKIIYQTTIKTESFHQNYIYIGYVEMQNETFFVRDESGIKVAIGNGFKWCYISDLENIDE